jgi:predicted nuclease of predicted toxin-antitoxin system
MPFMSGTSAWRVPMIARSSMRRSKPMIVAEDADFGTILAMRGESRPSAILFRCRFKSTERLLPLLLASLPRFDVDLAAGAIVVIEETRIRVRRLPI